MGTNAKQPFTYSKSQRVYFSLGQNKEQPRFIHKIISPSRRIAVDSNNYYVIVPKGLPLSPYIINMLCIATAQRTSRAR